MKFTVYFNVPHMQIWRTINSKIIIHLCLNTSLLRKVKIYLILKILCFVINFYSQATFFVIFFMFNILFTHIKWYVVYDFVSLYPHHKMWGGAILDSLCPVGRSVRPSVSNSCPLYNSFTNGRISFKLEWHIYLN